MKLGALGCGILICPSSTPLLVTRKYREPGTSSRFNGKPPNSTWRPAGEIAQPLGSRNCRDGKSPDVNEYGIGICLVGDLERSPPTARQVAAARALVAYLRDRYQIPADHTETHAHLAAAPTSCSRAIW